MTATLQTFTRALLTPDLSFRTLTDARAVCGADGLPQLMRTTRFAEAEITHDGRRWLLFLPLTPAALYGVERIESRLRKLRTDFLTEYRILPDELLWYDTTGKPCRTSLVIEPLPAGRSFDEALGSVPAEELLRALDTLQQALRELHFSHNNLRAENLRWAAGRFIPIRYHDARFDTPGRDDEAFGQLRERILQCTGGPQVSDAAAAYTALRPLDGHRWTSHLFEGLVCVEDDAGYGYVDAQNRRVIAPQFRWAGDFHEGRAEVETDTGMGLIDKQGRYIIPPEYEIVEYDPVESIVRVRLHGRRALYDYLGRRLTEFGAAEP
mgnify:CR=1 FL=1